MIFEIGSSHTGGIERAFSRVRFPDLPAARSRWVSSLAALASNHPCLSPWRSSAYLRVVKAVRNSLQNAERVPELIVTESHRILLIGLHGPEYVTKNRGL
jgi:hypothetical protein